MELDGMMYISKECSLRDPPTQVEQQRERERERERQKEGECEGVTCTHRRYSITFAK